MFRVLPATLPLTGEPDRTRGRKKFVVLRAQVGAKAVVKGKTCRVRIAPACDKFPSNDFDVNMKLFAQPIYEGRKTMKVLLAIALLVVTGMSAKAGTVGLTSGEATKLVLVSTDSLARLSSMSLQNLHSGTSYTVPTAVGLGEATSFSNTITGIGLINRNVFMVASSVTEPMSMLLLGGGLIGLGAAVRWQLKRARGFRAD